jgi:tetratricopeptide (TPR) repeat protein
VFASYHYESAVNFISQGEKGRAIQELHMSTMLNRRDPVAALLLGKLYLESGAFVPARKYLSSPILMRNDEAKNLLEQLDEEQAAADKNRWVLFGSTAAGAAVCIPLIALVRRMRRKKSAEEIAFQQALENGRAPGKIEAQAEVELQGFSNLKGKKAPTAPVVQVQEASEPVVEFGAEPSVAAFQAPVGEPVVERVERPAPKPVADEPVPVLRSDEPPPVIASPASQKPESKPEWRSTSWTQPPAKKLSPLGETLIVASAVDKELREGNKFAEEGNGDLARRAYRTALALNPRSAEAYLGLAYLFFVESNWDMALEHYVRALEFAPDSAEAHYGIGRVLLETDRINEAVSELERTISLDPTFTDARDTLTALGRAA